MIYVTGDTHGELRRFSPEVMPGEDKWTAEDTLIVTGDFGFLFRGESRDPQETAALDALSEKPYTILFVDGNHEGFPFLEACPEEARYGAPVNVLRGNIFRLRRGYVYTIEGKRFFVMGGAYSMDKAFRVRYEEICGERIWFPEELPTAEEYRRAIAALEKENRQVDYILTHTAPRSIIPRLICAAPDPHDRELTGFLDWVYHEVTFRRWFFGHFHMDMELPGGMTACFEGVYPLEENGCAHGENSHFSGTGQE